ncbi:hypothetical protein K6119_12250 [Paracrocinitomix mangrovi]|uniref:hypothetical protein n=1 Tax=Paracrocinitomix mangrovi TaxID=2862509 RepID=UPI001C8D3819|nr:hypothetical protein [Paracrocinitomix mangrovi]UKN00503.1 hypothetical protein K6119_12250 [Paracrocinitomix mangrovi]
MKKLFTLALSLFTFSAFSQVSVKETNVNIDGAKNGFEIEIPYADVKACEKELKDLFKSWKGSFSEKKGVMKADDCKDKEMGENTFDVFGTVVENGEKGSKALVAVDLGGAYLSSKDHASQYKVMEQELKTWAIKTATIYVGEIEKQEEKNLDDRKKELDDLEKDQKKKEEEIEDYKKKIEENEKAIEQSKKDQEKKKEEIKQQEGVLQEVITKKEGIK